MLLFLQMSTSTNLGHSIKIPIENTQTDSVFEIDDHM